jgi:RND family efflux transporter MFP subunit
MPRSRTIAYSLLGLAVAAATIVAVELAASPKLGAQQQAAAPPPPAVTVSKPLARPIQDSLEFSGQFAPIDYVEVRARVNGYLTEVHFTDGQIVKKGDLLFVIDPRPYEDALDIAKAQVAQAEAALELAKRQLARGDELVKKEYLAQSDYDTRVQQLAQAEAQLNGAKAQVKDAQINLEFTRVTAPVGGRVGAHQVSIGNLIGGGEGGAQATLLATIVSLDPIWFAFDLSENDYLALGTDFRANRQADGRIAGVPIQIRFSGESGWPHKGTLDFLDNQIERSSGTLAARATVPNSDFAITPGQFAHVRVPLGPQHPALLLPDAAIITDQNTRMVMTVAGDGTVTPKQVTVGPVENGLREVRTGLGPDDQVVIAGLMRVRAGAKVTPQPGTIAPPAAD